MDENSYNAIVMKLDEWVAKVENPDAPMVGMADEDGHTLSPRQILESVKERKPLGEKLIQNWMNLALRHIMNASLEGPSRDTEKAGL